MFFRDCRRGGKSGARRWGALGFGHPFRGAVVLAFVDGFDEDRTAVVVWIEEGASIASIAKLDREGYVSAVRILLKC